MIFFKSCTWILLFTFAAAGAIHAEVTITWTEDTSSAFDVTLSGSGLFTPPPSEVPGAGWGGILNSPSGLWQLSTRNWASYVPDANPAQPINIFNNGDMTYLGAFSHPSDVPLDPHYYDTMRTARYNDFLAVDNIIQDGASWNYGFFYDSLSWRGVNTFTITSLPDLNDPGGWTWVADYHATGNAPDPVPEPAPFWLGLAGLVVAAG